MVQKITLEGLPPSKKNSKQIFINRKTGKRFITSSSNYKAWETETVLMFKTMLKKIKGSVAMQVMFNTKSKYKKDLSNSFEGIADALVLAGIIEDDNWYVLRSVNLWRKESDHDYTEIYIYDNEVEEV
jgi:Holliday junction resolvase RusA-like endonuclease